MKRKLHTDIETFSSVDIATCGLYKYMESLDFEVLMVAYAFDDGPIKMVDLAQGESLPVEFIEVLEDENVIICAHNAAFERNAFKTLGYDIPTHRWECTMIKAAYCGLPLSLEAVSKALKLEEKGKSAEGKALIRYFSVPVKPTKTNGMRCRNFPRHNPEKWKSYKSYCTQDVEAEREIDNILETYTIPESVYLDYQLDQKINDRGILIDTVFAEKAIEMDQIFSSELLHSAKELTGLDNPNSPAQLKRWLSKNMKQEITSLAKGDIPELIDLAGPGKVSEVLKLRVKMAKTSIKKYVAMLCFACDTGRAHGLFQFYGANRTGRWAGRGVQLQNLPRNKMKDLENARQAIRSGDYELAIMLYDNISNVLSELIRTALIPEEGNVFGVADFSAIEARVLAWLAQEKWRLDVFSSHGQIYEASASMMFGIPIESITKGSMERDKGKIAELALGYQGALGALKTMGGEEMGLSETEMQSIVKKWRKANPAIVAFWADVDKCAIQAMTLKRPVYSKFKNLIFDYDGTAMTIELPSKRKLFYWNPSLTVNKWGSKSIKYRGMDQTTKQWTYIDTYGGKITENIVQAVARDILADSMQRLDKVGFDIVAHVHDEVVCELPLYTAKWHLGIMCEMMGEPIEWATGLPLNAEGFITEFYKKD